MKTAISIPDPLFQAAEQFARSHGLSRSELYVRALKQYLQAQQDHTITENLNHVYREETSTLDPALAYAQTRTLSKEDW